MRILIIVLLLLFAYSANAQDEKFFYALHQVETSGRTGEIYGDGGRSLGPYQISKAYWLDATYRSPKLRKAGYKSVTRKDYAKQIVLLYCSRYERRALVNKDWETLARLHNSGPSWRKKKHLTDSYWKKIRKHL